MRVVLVGGTLGAVRLAWMLRDKPGFEIVIISDKTEYSVYSTELSLMAPLAPIEKSLPIADIFTSSKNVTVCVDQVVALNTRVSAIKTHTGDIFKYDSLVMCDEEAPHSKHIKGLDEFAHHVYGYSAFTALKSSLVELFRITHRKRVRVVIVGAGLAGVELAGSLRQYADEVADRYNIAAKDVEIELIEQRSKILPMYESRVSELAKKRLEKIGVDITLNARAVSFSQNAVQLEKQERSADIIVWAGGGAPLDIYAKYPEVFELSEGRPKVDARLQVPKAPQIRMLNGSAQHSNWLFDEVLHTADFLAKALAGNTSGQHISSEYIAAQKELLVVIGRSWALTQKGSKIRSGAYANLQAKKYGRKLAKKLNFINK